jgi:hypothetical protein
MSDLSPDNHDSELHWRRLFRLLILVYNSSSLLTLHRVRWGPTKYKGKIKYAQTLDFEAMSATLFFSYPRLPKIFFFFFFFGSKTFAK